VFRQLNKVYQTKLVALNEELGKQVITVTFDNDNIDTIIDIISETLVLKYTRTEGNQVIFENTTQLTTP
jgi:ferric-dicitrate binding protein FerR (iron transport regulator)